MNDDVPIPEEIYEEFQPFIKSKRKCAQLFDQFNLGDLSDLSEIEKEMPSHSKGQNCLDKYFSKVNLNDSSNCFGEMGKKNAKLSEVHKMSSSESENETTTIEPTRRIYAQDDDDMNCKENIEFEDAPSKPIIAAMNALGKLKKEISVLHDDNSSRDSTALVIDEEQLESEKDPTASQDEMVPSKSSPRKSLTVSNNEVIVSSKDSANRSLSGKATVADGSRNDNCKANDSMSITQFFNVTKTTSTPVDNTKSTKRKRSETSPEHSRSKKHKEKYVDTESDCWSESARLENMVEINPLRDGSCPLFLEDLNSDDEVYVVQCPKDVKLESLVGKELELNGESLLKLQVSGEKRFFECYSQKDSMERHVNIILPSKSEGVFKFGVHQLKGSIVISESFNTPEVQTDDQTPMKQEALEDMTPKESSCEPQMVSIEKHKKQKKRNTLDNAGERSITSPNEEITSEENNASSSSKKHKKKKLKEESISKKEENNDVENSSKKIKKDKKKEEELTHDPEQQIIISEEKSKKKKKKKHYDDAERIKEPEVVENVLPEEAQEINPVKKKKKKKDREDVNVLEPVFVEPVTEPEVESHPVKKKKKKKYQEQSFTEDSSNIQEFEASFKKEYMPSTEGDTLNLNAGTEVEVIPSHLKFSTFFEADARSISKKKKKKKKKKSKDVLLEE